MAQVNVCLKRTFTFFNLLFAVRSLLIEIQYRTYVITIETELVIPNMPQLAGMCLKLRRLKVKAVVMYACGRHYNRQNSSKSI